MDALIPESPPQIIDGITLKFPAVIWRIVNSCTTGAISWETDGTSIRVDKAKFEDEYLKSSTFFKTKNFQSFIRQLNIYGFRKMPTNYPKGQEDAIFVYRHDFFRRGHPELLTEVVRNTAIRKTQRENHIREVEAKHGKIKEVEQLEESPLLVKVPVKKKVDESHPLLKSPAEPVMRYGVPVEPLIKSKSKVTTVYLNPRVPVCDMQRMSPTKLHHQVADLLTAINNSDDEEGPVFKRARQYRTIQRPAELEPKSKKDGQRYDQMRSSATDSLSQESSVSKLNDQLMFGCPLEKDDDDDDLNIEFDQTNQEDFNGILNCFNTDVTNKCFSLDDSLTSSLMSSENIDVLNGQTLSTGDNYTQFGEDQTILTPAYFDPGTGTVTLLLPALNPEY